MNTTACTPEEARRVLQREYGDDIRAYAEDLAQRIAEGEIVDREALDEAVHETTDGCELVIYTGRSLETLRCSDNWLARDEEEGPGHNTADLSDLLPRYAYYAVRADLMATLDRHFGVPMGEDVDPATVAAALAEYRKERTT